MCIIIDTNMQGKYMDPNDADMRPVRNWINDRSKRGRIVYSKTTDFERETLNQFKKQFVALSRSGKLKMIDTKQVTAKQKELKKQNKLISNDPHIIALALVARAKVLVSSDQNLHNDFKQIGGSVYQTAQHKHLLTADLCP